MPFDTLAGMAVYRVVHGATFYGFTFGWSFRVAGRPRLPAAGPALLLANHQSFLDPVLVGCAATRPLTYLARSTLWDSRPLGRVIDYFGGRPIDRGFGKEGLQTVLGELGRGRAVLVFPEGERTHTGELQPLKPGVSLLVKRATCPVVPVGVAGTFQAWPRQAKRPTPDFLFREGTGRGIAVAFGAPIDPGRYHGVGRDEMLADLQAEIATAYRAAEAVRRK